MVRQYNSNKRELSPPYAPWSEMEKVLKRLRGFRPPCVDIAFLQTHRIAPRNERAVINALKFLGIIDADGVPTELLARLKGGDSEYRENLAAIVKSAYADLFARVDIQDADVQTLRSYFMTQKVGQSVVPKCTRFLIGIAREADMELSLDLNESQPSDRPRALRQESPQVKIVGRGEQPRRAVRGSHSSNARRGVRDHSTILLEAKLKLVEKLPNFDSSWQPEAIELVFREFQKLADRLGLEAGDNVVVFGEKKAVQQTER
ncbi:DUF5343 domain-containing protein [Chloroflexota bacterium]